MDTDDERLRVQDAEAALATEQKGVTPATEEKQMAGRKMCQPERKLSWTRPCWMPDVLF